MIKENNDEYKIIKERRLWKWAKWDHHMEHISFYNGEHNDGDDAHRNVLRMMHVSCMPQYICQSPQYVSYVSIDFGKIGWPGPISWLHILCHTKVIQLCIDVCYISRFSIQLADTYSWIYVLYNIYTSIEIFVCRWHSGTMLNWKINRQQQIELEPNQNETKRTIVSKLIFGFCCRCWDDAGKCFLPVYAMRTAVDDIRCTVVHSHAHTYTIKYTRLRTAIRVLFLG